MPKLTRKSAKLFAENATAAAGGLAQFGSLAAGTPNFSTDPDVIQALPAYSNGWSSAVLGTKSPAIEDRNALDYLLSYQQAYIMQHGVPEWLDTETYYENSYVIDSNGELRVSTIDNNIGHDPVNDEGAQYWGYAGARGAGKQIGEVYYSQSKLATDNKGALPLFTGELISNADQLYPQFYAWVNSHTDLCVSEADWQTAVTTYGECPKYVINTTAKTIRLPILKSFIKMANPSDGITQDKASASLADHYHIFGINSGSNNGEFASSNGWVSAYMPNIPEGSGTRGWNGSGGGGGYAGDRTIYSGNMITTNAIAAESKEGAKDTKVAPTHTTLYPWVCAYNGAAPASMAQAAEFQDALSGKVDLAPNVAQADVDYVIESYQSSTSWYRVYKSGWCEQGGYVTQGNENIYLLKEFVDTNYSVLTTFDASGNPLVSCGYNQKTTDNFYLFVRSYGQGDSYDGICWEAKGYIENSSEPEQ